MRRTIRNFILIPLLLAAGALGLFIAAIYAGIFGSLPDKGDWEHMETATASLVQSADGELIGRFFLENRTNLDYEQLPAHLVDALIATEDHRFYRHRGLDTRSMVRVLVRSVLLRDPNAGGGSTITQQLAKNLFGRERHGYLTLPVNKTKEIIIARRLEKAFSKEEILTFYLNSVPFGENVFGIETAAQRFFSKPAAELSVQESAVLVGMLKANTSYNPRLYPDRSLARRNVVIGQMERRGYLPPEAADSIQNLPLGLTYSASFSEAQTGYFLNVVKRETTRILEDVYEETGVKYHPETDGLLIRTTLDMALQQYALGAFRTHLGVMQSRLDAQYRTQAGRQQFERIVEREFQRSGLSGRGHEVRWQQVFSWDGIRADSLSVRDSLYYAMGLLHGGVFAIDPASGAITTYIGGIDHATHPWDQVMARRQLASAFKPILYAAALETGIAPCSYFDNDSLVITDFTGYSPVNHDGSYGGRYSMTGALAHSMNVPTFNLFMETGFEPVNRLWEEMGFSYPLRNIPSLALGTAEARIRELAVAYAAFANGGYLVEPYTITSISAPDGSIIYQNERSRPTKRVVSEETSLLISAMLREAVNNGTAASLRSRYGVNFPAAAKTGTSQNYADAWFAAYNPGLVMVSRVGASSPAVHFHSGTNGSASVLALPIVGMTMQQIQSDPALKQRFIRPFPSMPEHLVSALDCAAFEEKRFFDRLIDRFRDPTVTFEEEKHEEKPGLLRRLFRRN